ncbi:MAG: glycosyltransferase [Bacteroidales bacterium]|nr:MAG: glycosyltransferase [Bacteroidales bacterium]
MSVNNLFKDLKVCVIIPSYNNDRTLADVIDRVLLHTCNVIVVNDGATDSTDSILKSYQSLLEIVTHKKNKGKGYALQNGFKRALELGYEYAITIDSDGQHFPEDLPKLIERSKEEPNSLIIGARNMSQEDVPGGSSFGNRFSNFWFMVETGIKLPDTQSGYRVYPIKKLEKLTFYCKKFEYEIEVPVRASWSGIPVISEPVQIRYDQGDDRISHFRPFIDFFRISVLNTILCFIAFAYIKPRNFIKNLSWKNIKVFLDIKGENNFKLATSIGFGVFMGIVPIWGYQMIVALALAYLLKLHKPFVIVAANISIPPMIPFIIFASLASGALIMGIPITNLSFSDGFGLDSIANNLLQYIIGSVVLASVAGIFSGSFSYLLLLILRRK